MVGGKRFQDAPTECAVETEVQMKGRGEGSGREQRDTGKRGNRVSEVCTLRTQERRGRPHCGTDTIV